MRKMLMPIFLWIILATLGNAEQEDLKCDKPNQVYRECSIPCLPTCKNLNPPQCRPRECKPGCQCDWGFVSDEVGNCILPSNCQKIITRIGRSLGRCSSNEVETSCMDVCPATCENRNPPACAISKCSEGCDCKPGLVRNKFNKCVNVWEC